MTDTSPEPEIQPVITRSRRSDNAKSTQQEALEPSEPPKKKRKSIKPNPDKKFDCKHPGCGKSYSRAEHLYRHQLNHTPKQIYRCDFPGCNRYFVRQDLCVRHRERHTTQGSQLQKRDSFTQSSSKADRNLDNGSNRKRNSEGNVRLADLNGDQPDPGAHDTDNDIGQHTRRRSSSLHGVQSPTINNTNYYLPQSQDPGHLSMHLPRSNSIGDVSASPGIGSVVGTWNQPRQLGEFFSDTRHQPPIYSSRTLTTDSSTSPMQPFVSNSLGPNHMHAYKTQRDAYPSAQDFHDETQDHEVISPTGMTSTLRAPQIGQALSNSEFVGAMGQSFGSDHSDTYNFTPLNSLSAPNMGSAYGYPIFGGGEFKHSPVALGDEFAAWLFNNDPGSGPAGFSPNDTISNLALTSGYTPQLPHSLRSPTSLLNSRHNDSILSNPMDLTNVLGQPQLSNNHVISEDKRQELLDMIQLLFIDRPHDAVKKRKDSIFEGDIDGPGHILSLTMMHNYIASYWYHQHAQLPILHKPTFSADKTPNLLLLAIIAIGAATLDKAYGGPLTDSAADFANFLTWHIRWEIMRDRDFRPPAKLWVFQTLLLIEVYEKMYSTRALHERAHIHHDSTLTLMRRGSSLTGKPATATPSNGQDESSRTDNVNDTRASWESWIDGEATRRVAFAAFVIDSIHCTMFGHSAKMVAHEMRLPLPCDERLWSAATPAEASRLNALLTSKGVKQSMFLDSLRRTLRGEKVHTNTFGRTIIMAGLLSVSYHMTQRDIQMISLGQNRGTSGVDKSWKSGLLRAYDNWKKDFDESLDDAVANMKSPLFRSSNRVNTQPIDRLIEGEAIFESRTVLHHLAHIAAHVDIVDCQIFAGASRLLSRSVTPKDVTDIRGKVERWATKASARDSAFYALKFIAQVLVQHQQGDYEGEGRDDFGVGPASPILPQAYDSNKYVARDDFLLNRPWVLYVSALVVWCYGFALEGPIKPPPRDADFATYEQREADMQKFLDRVAGVEAPDDLEHVTGKNRCLGLLLILEESFASTRWELTHEASRLLGNAAQKLKGIHTAENTMKRRR